MAPYPLWLRKKMLACYEETGSPTEVARRCNVGRASVYRFINADKRGALAPNKPRGTWRKLDPEKLREHVAKHPGATLAERAEALGGCLHPRFRS